MLRGQFVILILGVVGLAAALFAVGMRRAQEARVLEYWGSPLALQIRDARSTELLTLAPRGTDGPSLAPTATLDELRARATSAAEVRQRPGASHLWHALLLDESYRWEQATGDGHPPEWTHALVFDRGETSAPPLIVLLDLEGGWLRGPGARRAVSIEPLRKYARRVLVVRSVDTAARDEAGVAPDNGIHQDQTPTGRPAPNSIGPADE